MMRGIYIFDLDGTIALNDHRQHHVRCEKPDWKSFSEACVHDKPNWPVIETLRTLRKTCEVWIWSGRTEDVREQTLDWMMNHRVIDNRQYRFWYRNPDRFRMRPSGDFTPDDELKQRWLNDLHISVSNKLVGVFDDRRKVVDMWRRNGVACFQVADGNF